MAAKTTGKGKARAKGGQKTAADVPEDISVEDALERLEGLVEQLEDGELPLEEALGAFEKGVALSRKCGERIQQAEQRVEVLLQEAGEVVRSPFSAEDDLD